MASLPEEATKIPSDLAFEAQHTTESLGRPDIAGLDEHGHLRVLVEAKFDAGFTEHQPVHYLDQLPADGVLVVICPDRRLSVVWRELNERLRTAKREATEKGPVEPFHVVVDGKHLVLQSWRRVLNAVRLELSGDPEVLSDVVQLDGLCTRMDSEAFIPMTSEELTSNIYRRVHEFGAIVDDVVATLTAEGIVTTKRLRSAAANGWYGRYVRLRGTFAFLHVSTWSWTLGGPSPLWLTVYGSNWKGPPALAKKQLAGHNLAHPGSVREGHGGYPSVMLRVPIGAERTEVITSVMEQLREIGEIIAPLGVGAKDEAPPDEALPGEPA